MIYDYSKMNLERTELNERYGVFNCQSENYRTNRI
jgi:hypothetical protein